MRTYQAFVYPFADHFRHITRHLCGHRQNLRVSTDDRLGLRNLLDPNGDFIEINILYIVGKYLIITMLSDKGRIIQRMLPDESNSSHLSHHL